MIQVEHFKWIHNNRLLASKDASKWKAHGNTNKDTYGKKAKVFENRFRTGGEENERQMANNVMRGIRVCDGYLVCLDLCVDSSATAPEILLATS